MYLGVELWITWQFYIKMFRTPKAQSTRAETNGATSNKTASTCASQREHTRVHWLKREPPRESTEWRKRQNQGRWQREDPGHKQGHPAQDTNKDTPHRTQTRTPHTGHKQGYPAQDRRSVTEKQTRLTSNTMYSQNSSVPSQTLDNLILLKTSALAGKSELAGHLPSLSDQVLAQREQRDLKESQPQLWGILFVLFQLPNHANKWWVTSWARKGD
jgi:hypothetical protein